MEEIKNMAFDKTYKLTALIMRKLKKIENQIESYYMIDFEHF